MTFTNATIVEGTETIGLNEMTDEQLRSLILYVQQMQKQKIDEHLQAKLEADWATDGGQNC